MPSAGTPNPAPLFSNSDLKKDGESVYTRRVRMSDKKKNELLHDHNNDGVVWVLSPQ